MNDFGLILFWCIVQVTGFAFVASLFYLLLRRLRPAAGAPVALASLLVIIGLTALAASPWPRWWSVDGLPTGAAAPIAKSPDGDQGPSERAETTTGRPDAADGPVDAELAVLPDQPSLAAVFWHALHSELRRAPADATRGGWRWPGVLALLIVAGTGFGLVRLLAGLLAVRAYRRKSHPVRDRTLLELVDELSAEMNCPRSIEIRASESLTTPATVGWRRPLVLLPAEWKSWTDKERRAVLAHEMAHIERQDFLACVFGQLGLTLHFYHPLVHWLLGRLRLEQELAADAMAASRAGGQVAYLQTLAAMALRQDERPLGWPARTFLPTRGTFLRRIDMLRSTKSMATSLSAGPRVAAVAVLILVAGLVSGLRDPSSLRPTIATAAEPAAPRNQGIELSYVPADAVAVTAIRHADIFNRPVSDPIVKMLNEDVRSAEPGLPLKKMEQITIVMLPTVGEPPERVGSEMDVKVIRMLEPFDVKQHLERLAEQDAVARKGVAGEVTAGEVAGQTIYRSTRPERLPWYFQVDERTMMVSTRANLKRMIESGKTPKSKLVTGEDWQKVQPGVFAATVDSRWVTRMRPPHALSFAGMDAFAPLWAKSQSLTLGVDLDERFTLSVIAQCANRQDAMSVIATGKAMIVLAQNIVQQMRTDLEKPDLPLDKAMLPDALAMLDALNQFLEEAQFEQKDGVVEATLSLDLNTAAKVPMLMLAIIDARQAARYAQSTSNLKRLAFAMQLYHDTHRRYPPAVLLGPDGKTPYSWRVALLPFVEASDLNGT